MHYWSFAPPPVHVSARMLAEAFRTAAGAVTITAPPAGDHQRARPLRFGPDTVTQLMPKLIEGYNNPTTRATRGHPAQPLPKAQSPLPQIRLHDLRHLHATLLLLEGVPVHVVANRLGHSDPAVTLRVYAHVLRESAAGVADIFARAVSTKAVSKNSPEKHETRGPVL